LPAASIPLKQPHDSLIRHTFGSPGNAGSLFRAQLPPSLAEVLNWERIQLESGSFVDAELRRSECDLLFRVPIHGTEGDEALNVDSRLDLQKFAERIKSTGKPTAAETIMSTLAERIRAEGKQEGLVRGALIGKIQALEAVLGRPESEWASLVELGSEQLSLMIAALEREVRKQ